MNAMTRRLISLAGSNSVLLALAVLLPVGMSFLWWGPLRSSLQALEEERAQHVRDIQVLGARTEEHAPLDAAERLRLGQAASAIRQQTVSLGSDVTSGLVRQVAKLLERAGVSEVRVTVEPVEGRREADAPPTLEVPSLENGDAFVLVPHPVQVRARANFVDLRRALDKLHDPGVPAQIQRASFVRDGFQVQSELDLVYWSREDRS